MNTEPVKAISGTEALVLQPVETRRMRIRAAIEVFQERNRQWVNKCAKMWKYYNGRPEGAYKLFDPVIYAIFRLWGFDEEDCFSKAWDSDGEDKAWAALALLGCPLPLIVRLTWLTLKYPCILIGACAGVIASAPTKIARKFLMGKP